jgi:hypothetical protein
MSLMGKPAAGGAGRSPSPSPEPPKRKPHPIIGRELSESQKIAARKFIAEMKEAKAAAAAAAAKKPLTGADLPKEVAEKIVSMVPSEKKLANIFLELTGTLTQRMAAYNMIMYIITQISRLDGMRPRELRDFGIRDEMPISPNLNGEQTIYHMNNKNYDSDRTIHSLDIFQYDKRQSKYDYESPNHYYIGILPRRTNKALSDYFGLNIETAIGNDYDGSKVMRILASPSADREERWADAIRKAKQIIHNLTKTSKGDIREEFASFFIKRMRKDIKK